MADDSDDEYGSEEFEDDFEDVEDEEESGAGLFSPAAEEPKTMAQIIAEENKQALLARQLQGAPRSNKSGISVTPSSSNAMSVPFSALSSHFPTPSGTPSPRSASPRPTTPQLPKRQYAVLPQGQAEPLQQRRSAVRIGSSDTRAHASVDQRLMDEQVERTRRLVPHLRLSEEYHDLLELRPLTETETFVRKMRTGAVVCASTQHNDDWVSKEVQTEPVAQEPVSCQAPDDLFAAAAAGTSSNTGLADGGAFLLSAGLSVGNGGGGSVSSTLSLQRFVHAAGQLLERLVMASQGGSGLEAKGGGMDHGFVPKANFRIPVCFRDRAVTATCFSPLHSNLFAVALTPPAPLQQQQQQQQQDRRPHREALSDTDLLATRSVVLLWDLRLLHSVTAVPQLLYCDGVVCSVGISPVSDHLVFAGLQEGSLVLWDLRDSSLLHRPVTLQWWDPDSPAALAAEEVAVKQQGKSRKGHSTAAKRQVPAGMVFITARHAAFSTHSLVGDNHSAPVISVQGIGMTATRGSGRAPAAAAAAAASSALNSVEDLTASARLQAAAAEAAFEFEAQLEEETAEFDFVAAATRAQDGSKQSFQVASLDSSGEVIIWTIVELRADTVLQAGGSEHELGLDIGSRVKLIKSATVVDPSWTAGTALEPILRFSPDDPNEFFSTSLSINRSHVPGAIMHRRRFGGAPSASHYVPGDSVAGDMVACTCIAFSPFVSSLFLAGYSDGRVCLFSTRASVPMCSWECPSSGGSQQLSGRWAVLGVQWSSRSAVRFYAVSADAQLHTWDLGQHASLPVASSALQSPELVEPHQHSSLALSWPQVSDKEESAALLLAHPVAQGIAVLQIQDGGDSARGGLLAEVSQLKSFLSM